MPQTNDPGAKLRIAGFILVTLLVFLLHVQTIGFKFVMWDDDISIYRNTHLVGLNWDTLLWAFTNVDLTMRYMPLTLVGWLITYDISGLAPWAFHLGNLLLFSLSAGLLFLLILELLDIAGHSASNTAGPDSKPWKIYFASMIGALLWACHPLRVEMVAWANERGYCQAVFFLLWALLLYIKQTKAGERRRKMFLSISSALLYLFSLLSHPIGISVFLAIFLIDAIKKSKKSLYLEKRSGLVLKSVFFLEAVVVGGITLAARLKGAGLWTGAVGLSKFGIWERLSQAMYIVTYYVFKPLIPFHLTPFYVDLIDFDPFSPLFISSAAFALGVTLLLFLFRSKSKGLWYAWLAHLALLLPVMGFTEHPHYPADRYGVLQALVPSIVFAFWFVRARAGLALRTGVSLSLAAVALLSWASFEQAGTWRNSKILFSHMLRLMPGSAHYCRADVQERFARYLKEKGDLEDAIKHIEAASRNRPNDVALLLDYGAWLEELGRPGKALDIYRRAKVLAPGSARCHYLYGRLLSKMGKNTPALAELEEAVRLDPGKAWFHNDLGIALLKAHKLKRAFNEIKHALELRPLDRAIQKNFKSVRSLLKSAQMEKNH
ncbi:MAG: tetratricopeptide repeat protein [Deltaproteobacteria bacterium]|nr:tetratricopeptide repeat protein [Deltaproteobacteria bacterium]